MQVISIESSIIRHGALIVIQLLILLVLLRDSQRFNHYTHPHFDTPLAAPHQV